jgi:energy-coupling factor transporter ATP-binding protein EcfA2
MDFFKIKQYATKSGTIEIYPDFIVGRSKDLMVRAKSFYAVWDAQRGLWSTDEYEVARLIDAQLFAYREKLKSTTESPIHLKLMSDFSTNTWTRFKAYLASVADNAKGLDARVTFQDSVVKKEDYVSRRLPYSLSSEKPKAYDELMRVLYTPAERKKLEWAVGAIFAGDAKKIQKFIVIYGSGGSGKSTFLNILQALFEGYYTTFEARTLTASSNAFATEAFRGNPLVAIDHDGDLSNIRDNTVLNSVVSHEEIRINEKYKPTYAAKSNAFLFVGTNRAVQITEAKSGLIRRLIDVQPSGKTIPVDAYHQLVSRIGFELGGIAQHCIDVYRTMGKNYYSAYKPKSMIFKTNTFFNFVDMHFYDFLEEDGVSLSRAWALYKEFCEESLIKHRTTRHVFRDELREYFLEFHPLIRLDGKQVRSYYRGFKKELFGDKEEPKEEPSPGWLVLDQKVSLLDTVAKDCPAQYASLRYSTPSKDWDDVTTVLGDLDTTVLHYVRLPENHIVIDFDIRDESGNKSPELNIAAATEWPPTYAEFSKSEAGIHLHYIWDGDATTLSRALSPGVEVKIPVGHAAIRRKLSACNDVPIASISSGIPKKKVKVINKRAVASEKALRNLVIRNLKKEIHPHTKPSVDFIYKVLDDAYKAGFHYDVRDLRPDVLVFANSSTNNSPYCVKLVTKMKFHSDEESPDDGEYESDTIVFYDVEVFPNLVIICWKYAGPDNACVHMINPTPREIEPLLDMRLVGFNNRRYDNHILYALMLGYNNQLVYEVSSNIVSGKKRALFREAYGLSYADVYDFASEKKSLKKWQLELGIHHQELPFPWDQPLHEKHWEQAIEYCDNDVLATEAVFNARKNDFVARQILADLSELPVNASTLAHTARIIFGKNRNPQSSFVYTDLSKEFPGYEFDGTKKSGKSSYMGEDPGEGGYVYSEPGFYTNVALLDIASMHPTSIVVLNLFGPYTEKYTKLIRARLAIKHKDYASAIQVIPELEKHLGSPDDAEALSYALKIVINIVYGLTSARFSNPFKDPRNVDNIVAKRGALFMIALKLELQARGYTVAHVKTDSVKIPNATQEVIDFVFEFGRRYGYTFEHEATYDKMLLVNDAVYVAKKKGGGWTATGKEFQHPYIFKTLFTRQEPSIADMTEIKTVTTSLWLDLNEGLLEGDHNYVFVGKAGAFLPIAPGKGGGILLRKKGDAFHAATGSKGYRWLETQMVRELKKEEDIDENYYRELVTKAMEHIAEFIEIDTLLD